MTCNDGLVLISLRRYISLLPTCNTMPQSLGSSAAAPYPRVVSPAGHWLRISVAFWATWPPMPQNPSPTFSHAPPAVATYCPAGHVATHDAMPACDAAVAPVLPYPLAVLHAVHESAPAFEYSLFPHTWHMVALPPRLYWPAEHCVHVVPLTIEPGDAVTLFTVWVQSVGVQSDVIVPP